MKGKFKISDDERRTAFEMLVLEGIAHLLHAERMARGADFLHHDAHRWLCSAVEFGDMHGNQSEGAPAYRRERFGLRP